MDKHIDLLGILFIAYNICGALAACIVFVAVVGGGFLSGDEIAIFYTSWVGTAIATLLGVLSVPGLIAAYGLLKRRAWGRYLAMVLGAMHLLAVPFGTALGIYTLWILVQDEAAAQFS